METFVCQIIGSGASKDLGRYCVPFVYFFCEVRKLTFPTHRRVMGYVYQPPTDMTQERVVITYDHGTTCMLPSSGRGLQYLPDERTP